MSRGILLFLLAVAAAVLGYYGWQRFVASRTPASPWDFVAARAALVVETPRPRAAWRRFGKYGTGGAWQPATDHLCAADTLFGAAVDAPVHVAFFRRGDRQLIPLFVVAAGSGTVEQALRALADRPAVQTSKRQFRGYLLRVVEGAHPHLTLTYCLHRGQYVASFAADLVEEALQGYASAPEGTFRARHAAAFGAPDYTDDDANAFFAPGAVAPLLVADTLGWWQQLAETAYLDVRLGASLLANGTAYPTADHFLTLFEAQQPVPLSLHYRAPAEATALYHYGLSDPAAWGIALGAYRTRHHRAYAQSWDTLSTRTPLPEFYSAVGAEALVCMLPTGDSLGPDRLALVALRDTAAALRVLDGLRQSFEPPPVVGEEVVPYLPTDLRALPVPDFPALLFGPPFAGFERCFYTVRDSVLVLTNRVGALRRYERAVADEATWGQRVRLRRWLAEANRRATLSYFQQVSAPAFVAWQVRRQEEAYALSALAFAPDSVPAAVPFAPVARYAAGAPVASRPYALPYPQDSRQAVLLQDATGCVTLFGPAGQDRFRDTLVSPLLAAHALPAPGGTARYAYATARSLHLRAASGRSLGGFPVALPDSATLAYLSPIDYDGGGNYRLLVASARGDLYLYDTTGQNLPGWTPRAVGTAPAAAPFHLRVQQRDLIISAQRNGTVHAFNRRGEPYPGFPVRLNEPLDGPPFVAQGLDFGDTHLTLVTRGGTVVRLNLRGEWVDRRQLLRPAPDVRFRLLADPTGEAYVIGWTTNDRFGVVDAAGQAWERPHRLPTRPLLQYFSFGAGAELVAVTDTGSTSGTYLYDRGGAPVGPPPLPGRRPVALVRRATGYVLYRAQDSTVVADALSF